MQSETEELEEFEDVISSDNMNDMFEHYRFSADKGQTPTRIDKFLFDRIQNASRTKIQEAIEAGYIFVNDKNIKTNYKVKPGDVIVVNMAQPVREIKIIPQEIPLDILFEDEHLIVLNKPAGLVVHPSYGHYSGTLINALAWHLKDNPLFTMDDPRPGLVHRIDKDTSGLLVTAKTEYAKMMLGKQFFDHKAQRKYCAVVWGNFEEDNGTIEGNIGRHPRDRKMMTVFPDGSYGKSAITHYSVIERLGYVSVVECVLETGRTHQIRAHMKYIGHPIFNDALYGGDEILKGTTFTKYKQFIRNCFGILPRQALHAKSLGLTHPVTGEELFFETELPVDMMQLIEKWRIYTSNRNLFED